MPYNWQIRSALDNVIRQQVDSSFVVLRWRVFIKKHIATNIKGSLRKRRLLVDLTRGKHILLTLR